MSNRRILSLALSFVLFLIVVAGLLTIVDDPALALGSTLYVAPGGDCGGASPCYATIQAAVDGAGGGDTIKVAQGVYTGVGFEVVNISKAITVTGGYSTADWTNSFPITQPTVIDAENIAHRRGVFIDGTDVPTITLDGLTIQNGHLPDDMGAGVYIYTGTIVLQESSVVSNTTGASVACWGSCSGAGMAIVDGSVTISDSLFANNRSNMGEGGGVYVVDGVATLEGNTFLGNYARYNGGALYMQNGSLTMSNNQVQGNQSPYAGGGLELTGGHARISNTIFQSNGAVSGDGGAMRVVGAGAEIRGSVFRDNYAMSAGGAVVISPGSATPVTIVSSVFESNSTSASSSRGGAAFISGSVNISDSIFSDNHAGLQGGSISVGGSSTPMVLMMDRNTVLSSTADTGGAILIDGEEAGGNIEVIASNDVLANNGSGSGAVYVRHAALNASHWTLVNNGDYALATSSGSATLTNTIVASHTLGGLVGFGVTADHSLFFNSGTPCSGGATCTNSISGDPGFINPAAGDYHLGPWSAAVDQGVDAGVMVDFEGEPRPMRLGLDLGADEQTELPIASFVSSSPDWLGETTVFTNTTYPFGLTTYLWDFGDGETSVLANPTHSYSTPGVYNVTCTASNEAGGDVFSAPVTVYGVPTAGFSADPVQGPYPLTVAFTNETATTPPGDQTLSYLWDFGDGQTSILPDPEHTYEMTGVYTATLTSANAAGADTLTRTNYITVCEPITAAFTGDPTGGTPPLLVAFTNQSSGDYTSSLWDFGDGLTSTVPSPSHTYSVPGIYTVTLEVSGPGGNDMETKEGYITVESWRSFLPLVLHLLPSGPDTRFGIQMYVGTEEQVGEAAAAGAARVRFPLYWSSVEPVNTTPSEYQWPGVYEQWLSEITAYNIDLILTIDGNPSWAATYAGGPIDKVPIDEFVEFVVAAVARYSAPPYNVKLWEFYNEPDNGDPLWAVNSSLGYWGNEPEAYADMLAAVYGPIKQVDPEAQVLLGGIAYDFWEEEGGPFVREFLDGVLQHGGGSYFDVLNFHYYPTAFAANWTAWGPGLIGKVTALREKLASYGLDKPLICTEAGVENINTGTDEIQSRYVPIVYVQAMAADLVSLSWFMLVDQDSGPWKTGLLYADLTRKPAFYAYQTALAWLGNASYLRALSTTEKGTDAIEAYRFQASDWRKRFIVAWSNDERTYPLTLSARAVHVFDKYGAEHWVYDNSDGKLDGTTTVPVGSSPVYLYPES